MCATERGLGEAGFLDGTTKAKRIKEEESVCAEIGKITVK